MLRFTNTRAKGNHGEQLALDYLIKQGLKLIEQNINSRYGEIDIVMRDGAEWIFVGVRFRQSQEIGGGLESVNSNKQGKLINTAEHYIQTHHITHFEACRFDIIEISGDINNPKINWIKDAFQANQY
jgi:putative endonuclease